MVQEFRYRLLGPLVAEYAGEHIRLGGFRQQVLLTMLLLEANQVVHLERLIDAIWDESPPASARNQVRICVSGLRRQFATKGGGDIIETHPVGYRILVAEDALDFHRFEKFACFDLELQRGQQRRIVGELTNHVSDHPFREKLCAQLMLALYLSGRQVDALKLFRITRKRLFDELGIEPSENLCALERRILTSDRSLRECPLGSLATVRPLPEPSLSPVKVPASRAHAGARRSEARAGEAAIEWRRTEDRLERLERDNARLRAEHDAFKRVMDGVVNGLIRPA
jgi:DNA-binding SARP family transcriptional activator